MKRVLVVGAGGYIGENFEAYVKNMADVDTVDSYEGWKNLSFEGYCCVLFAAGIAHRKQSESNKDLYFSVNRDLPLAVAQKAKTAGAEQFIYLSSMSVYSGTASKQGEITGHTVPKPRHNDYYGQSKYEAEAKLAALADDGFKVALIRPPMVYGRNCPGKFGQLVKLSKMLPVIPNAKNKRSMIYVDNLSKFLYTVVQDCKHGIFCPQNGEHVNTSEMIRLIRAEMGRGTLMIPGMAWAVKMAMAVCPPLKNAFGSLFYVREGDFLQHIPDNPVPLEDSVRESIPCVRL